MNFSKIQELEKEIHQHHAGNQFAVYFKIPKSGVYSFTAERAILISNHHWISDI